MRNLAFALLLGLAALVAIASRADASYQLLSKQVIVTITVTPSPIAYVPAPPRTAPVVVAQTDDAAPPAFEPFVPVLYFYASTQGNIPVSMNVQLDPTAKYLSIVQHTTTVMAAYGANTYLCAFEVWADYTTVNWQVTDWGIKSSPATFPIYSYAVGNPTPSLLSWWAEGISTAYTAYNNAGSPG